MRTMTMHVMICWAGCVAVLGTTGSTGRAIANTAAASTAPADDLSGRAADLASADKAKRQAAQDALLDAGPAAVPLLIAAADVEPCEAAALAEAALARLIERLRTPQDRLAVAEMLLDALKTTRNTELRARLVDHVGLTGQEAAVDGLYPYLSDAQLGEPARRAVLRIPTLNATQAIVAGLQISDEPLRTALLYSLGVLQDRRALPLLRSMALTAVDDPRRVAQWSLARIPDKVALGVLSHLLEQGEPGAIELLLTQGAVQADAGRIEEARQAFRLVTEQKSLTSDQFCRLVHGLGRAGNLVDLAWLEQKFDEKQSFGRDWNRVRDALLRAMAAMPGGDVTAKLVQMMEGSAGGQKVQLLGVLAAREAALIGDLRHRVIAPLSDRERQVRAAAVETILAAGLSEALPTLLSMRAKEDDALRSRIEEVIVHLQGGDATAARIKLLADAEEPADQILLIEGLAWGDPAQVLEPLTRASADHTADVRVAALRALARLRVPAALPVLVAALDREHETDRAAAITTLSKWRDDTCTQALLSAYEQAGERQQAGVLRVLAGRPAEAVTALMVKASASPAVPIRAAAAAGLSVLARDEDVPRLLTLVGQGPAEVTTEAVGGLLRIAQQWEASRGAEAAGLYRLALDASQTPAQTATALDGLARLARPEDAQRLDAAVAWMSQPDVQLHDAACRFVIRLAMQLPADQSDRTIDLLSNAVIQIPDDPLCVPAIEHVRKLGGKLDPAHDAGMLTRWHLAGPFVLDDPAAWSALPLVDALPDVTRPVTLATPTAADSGGGAWRAYHIPNVQGIVTLNELMGIDTPRYALACAEFHSPAAQPGRLLVGSDDSVAIWLNGQSVYARQAARPVRVDEDTVDVTFKTGLNRLLLKVVNTSGGWGFCVRIVGPDGIALPDPQSSAR